MNAVKDDNTIIFDGGKNYQVAEQIKQYIDNAMLSRTKTSGSPTLSFAEQLEKLLELKNQGGLTEQEFQDAKKKLIQT